MGRRKKNVKVVSAEDTPRELPAKHAKFLKQLASAYDSKQYKRALKAADSVLKVYPAHAETLALKGLVVYELGQTEEAVELVKSGIAADPASVKCWIHYGQLSRAMAKYTTALQAYSQAVRLEPTREDLLNEVAALAIHVNDLEVFLDTANTILGMSSDKLTHWFAVAVANYMMGNVKMALTVIDLAYDSAGGIEPWTRPPGRPVDMPSISKSEVLLFKLRLLTELGDHDAVLAQAETYESNIADKDELALLRAGALAALGRSDEVEAVFSGLLATNTENLAYHRGILAARGVDLAGNPDELDAATLASLSEFYAGLAAEYPRSHLIADLGLRFAVDDAAFGAALRALLPKPLRKGTTSLFNRVSAACTSPARWAVTEQVATEYLAAVTAGRDLDGNDAFEPPSTVLWVRYFLASLYLATGRPTEALAEIDASIAHTPTVVDLYRLKSDVYAACGNAALAADTIEYARSLDLQDRFLNTLAGKRLLAAGRVEDAMAVIALFTKDTDAFRSIIDMQAVWYMAGRAEAHASRGETGLALKFNHYVLSTFDKYALGQSEFHWYALRIGSLSAYVDMLRTCLAIRSDSRFAAAGVAAVNLYMQLARDADARADEETADRRARKAARKDRLAPYIAAYAVDAARYKKKDDDPYGFAYEDAADPLAEAVDVVNQLVPFHSRSPSVLLTAVRVHLASGKPVLALRSLVRLTTHTPTAPEATVARWTFEAAATTALAGAPDVIASFVSDRLATLPVPEAEATITSAPSLAFAVPVIAAAVDVLELAPAQYMADTLTALLAALVAATPVPLTAHDDVAAAYHLMVRLGFDAAPAFAATAGAAFPLSSHFAV